MQRIKDDEFKTLLIENLNNFNNYCEKNNITYFLMYGSLIGAARHQGIIPWDDDIDLIMPRPEYEKLVQSFNKDNKRYRLESYDTNSNFTAPLAKIVDTKTLLVQKYGFKEKVELGVYIDVFILDGLPEDKIKREKHVKRLKKYINKWQHANHVFRYENSSFFKDVLRSIYYLPSNIMGYKHYLKKIDKNCKKNSYNDSEYVGNLSMPSYECEVFPKSFFENYSMIFENIKCPVPLEYDKILNQLYGEWKKLPPVEQRKTHHKFDCYLREEGK